MAAVAATSRLDLAITAAIANGMVDKAGSGE